MALQKLLVVNEKLTLHVPQKIPACDRQSSQGAHVPSELDLGMVLVIVEQFTHPLYSSDTVFHQLMTPQLALPLIYQTWPVPCPIPATGMERVISALRDQGLGGIDGPGRLRLLRGAQAVVGGFILITTVGDYPIGRTG
jgi:hypothetical protein